MNFDVYYEDILSPNLDMIMDLYINDEVEYHNAIRLGSAMCDIEVCLNRKGLKDIQLDMLEQALDNFIERLKGIKRERLNKVM